MWTNVYYVLIFFKQLKNKIIEMELKSVKYLITYYFVTVIMLNLLGQNHGRDRKILKVELYIRMITEMYIMVLTIV